MASTITVRIARRGMVINGAKTLDGSTTAQCDLCSQSVDIVVSTSPSGEGNFACRDCLRHRLEATTLAMYELKDARKSGLPWGKISG